MSVADDETGAGPEAALHAPATLRNREAILAVLRRVLPASGLVLEVASGTGEHVVHFAAALPGLRWQPSDVAPAGRRSAAAHADRSGLPNILPPVALDAGSGSWPVAAAEAILCINMVHIAPWQVAEGLLAGAGRVLPPGAPLILYGSFREEGVSLAPSNAAFDADLRARDPAWGLREVAAVTRAAAAQGLQPVERTAMPANNLSLVFRKARTANC